MPDVPPAIVDPALVEPKVASMEVEQLKVLDDTLVEALEKGDIRLLCASWLLQRPSGYRIERRQALGVVLPNEGERWS